MKTDFRIFLLGLAVWSLCLASVSACTAQEMFHVSLDTTGLQTAATGPYSLDFQFTDGSGTNDANNTVGLSNFQFGTGGSATGLPLLTGNAAGNVSSGLILTDGSFFNEAQQGFTPGDLLSFDMSLSTNVDASGVPDEFSFGILDGTGSDIPTTGPADALLLVDIDSATPSIQTFGADAGRTGISLGPPTVTAIPGAAVPEPSALAWLIGTVGLGLSYCRLRRRR